MIYIPEQEETLRYLRERGTEADAATILSEARAAFGKFRDQLGAVAPAVRLVEPFPGRWSPQQILDHVVEAHRVAPAQLQRIIAGKPGNVHIRAYVQSAAPYAHPWRALVRQFEATHDAILGAAETLAGLPMPAVGAPVELVARRKDTSRGREIDWIEVLDWKAYLQALRTHVLQHSRQLEQTLEQIG